MNGIRAHHIASSRTREPIREGFPLAIDRHPDRLTGEPSRRILPETRYGRPRGALRAGKAEPVRNPGHCAHNRPWRSWAHHPGMSRNPPAHPPGIEPGVRPRIIRESNPGIEPSRNRIGKRRARHVKGNPVPGAIGIWFILRSARRLCASITEAHRERNPGAFRFSRYSVFALTATPATEY